MFMRPCVPVLIGSCFAAAGAAAQSGSVVLYGSLDVAITHRSDRGWAVDPQGGNRLGFRGVEALGEDLSATFRAEMRFDPDTGGWERTNRPPWQGESTVGLASKRFGALRLGRAMTAVQWYNGFYDPWALKTVATVQLYQTANYYSDLSQPAGAGSGRWSNGIFYDSPRLGGLLVAVSLQPRETLPTPKRPVSLAFDYQQSAFTAFAGFERSAQGSDYVQVAGSYDFGLLRLLGTVSRQDPLPGIDPDNVTGLGNGPAPAGAAIKAYGVSAIVPLPGGSGRIGRASKKFEGQTSRDNQSSLGYRYDLSKRSYIYTDVTRTAPQFGVRRTSVDLGIVQNF
ncbi:porin [Piscinibacter sp. HJYY11]|uniref:porin n=1 Tax=Piscinibacter sp. HJYY11 TaxID=2801333 RepID=UPI0028733433|nr:porin [Piscinibacter sp. HJYY11]